MIEAVRSGLFHIDGIGQIWRKTRKGLVRAEHAPRANSYLQVRWMKGGVRYNAAAHRIVWQHFNGDISAGFTINHKNGIKDDNRLSNLEIQSLSGQMKHAAAGGLRDQYGQRNPRAKLTDHQIAQIRLAYSHGGYTMAALAKRFSVSFQHVSKIVRGQRRPRQGGPTADTDRRHSTCENDPVTGRFTCKRRAGRLLEGVVHDEYPA